MEEGVVGELLNGPLGEVFDSQQLLTDVSGSGNNWYIRTYTQNIYYIFDIFVLPIKIHTHYDVTLCHVLVM